MAGRQITREHLGADATDMDVDIFTEAVNRLATEGFNGSLQAAEDYLWGNGDYFRRLPADLLELHTAHHGDS